MPLTCECGLPLVNDQCECAKDKRITELEQALIGGIERAKVGRPMIAWAIACEALLKRDFQKSESHQ